MMKIHKRLLNTFSLLPLIAACLDLHAQLLPFQGKLTGANGTDVSDGVRVVQFKMYDAPVGGRAVWNGEVHNLSINNGVVNTILGSKSSLSGVDFAGPLYLEITVDANGDGSISPVDPPLLPRQAVLPGNFSLRAEAAEVAQLAERAKIATDTELVQGEVLLQEISSEDGNTVRRLIPSIIQPGSIPATAIAVNSDPGTGVSNTQIANGAIDLEKLTESIVERLVPVGTIVAFWGGTPPKGWKVCNGEALSRDTHPELYEHLVQTDPASRTEEGVARLPDLRGVFLRGLDTEASVDPDGASRLIGSLQADAVGPHIHNRRLETSGFSGGGASMQVFRQRPGYANGSRQPSEGPIPGAAETRPVNVAINWIIKY